MIDHRRAGTSTTGNTSKEARPRAGSSGLLSPQLTAFLTSAPILASAAAASPKLPGRYLGETSDDIEVVADDLTPPLQRHARELAEITLGPVAVRSASGAASERATNELGHAVTRWMITLAQYVHRRRRLSPETRPEQMVH